MKKATHCVIFSGQTTVDGRNPANQLIGGVGFPPSTVSAALRVV